MKTPNDSGVGLAWVPPPHDHHGDGFIPLFVAQKCMSSMLQHPTFYIDGAFE